MVIGLLICMVKGMVLFMILMWLISMIPFIGPYIKDGALYAVTKASEYAGIANCGYRDGFGNTFKDIVDSEK